TCPPHGRATNHKPPTPKDYRPHEHRPPANPPSTVPRRPRPPLTTAPAANACGGFPQRRRDCHPGELCLGPSRPRNPPPRAHTGRWIDDGSPALGPPAPPHSE